MGRLGASAVAAAASRARTANELKPESPQNPGEGFGVPGDHGTPGNLWRVNPRQQKELAVPDCDDRRVELPCPANEVGRLRNDLGGLEDELDVVGAHGGRQNLQRAPEAKLQPPDPRDFP